MNMLDVQLANESNFMPPFLPRASLAQCTPLSLLAINRNYAAGKIRSALRGLTNISSVASALWLIPPCWPTVPRITASERLHSETGYPGHRLDYCPSFVRNVEKMA
jgi:hypothetical protein